MSRNHSTYDYVVVGAGSAGCVLAARLSEDPDTSVLLLEAGPVDDAEEIRMPAAAPSLLGGEYDWCYSTAPQAHAAGRTVPLPRGRTLGGSSAVNAMIYVRGNPLDFDAWRDKDGCAGWGYAELLSYFRRAENELRIERPGYVHPLHLAWLAAARDHGFATNGGFHPYRQEGVGFYQVTQRAGRRWSTADAYLRAAAGRRNLTVLTGAEVSQVLIEQGRAIGVRCRYGGTEYRARAGVEVLLCGGAIDTPKLLMLSGIGPASHLREHGIEVVMHAPQVGAGLQDHPLCVATWYTPRTPNLWEEVTEANISRWRREGSGPMAALGAEAGGFARTDPTLPAPDLQYHVVPAPVGDPRQVPLDMRVISVLISAIDVKSRGQIRLRCADPAAAPIIDPGYLSDEADLDVLAAGVRQARQIAAHQPLAELLDGEFAPGERVDDDGTLRDWVRRNVATSHHLTSSCAMGGAEDSVCDPDLRVRGVDRLRVVDASVMPTVPRGNTNAPTIAIAERAADLIRDNRPPAPAG